MVTVRSLGKLRASVKCSKAASLLDAESRIIDLAARSNITVSTMDARGLYTTELTASRRSPPAGRQQPALELRYAAPFGENVRERHGGTGRWNRGDVLP